MPNTAQLKQLLPGYKLIPICLRLANRNLTTLMYLVVLPNLYLSLSQLYANQVGSDSNGLKLMSYLIIGSAVAWLIINQAPIIYFVCKSAQGETPSLGESYRRGLKFIWQYLFMIVLFVLIVGFGLALFIVPGLLAAYFILQRYYLAPYYLIDQGLTIKDALEKSEEQTKPYFINILDVIAVQVILVLIAALIGLSSLIVGIALSTFIASTTVFLVALRYQEITAKLPHSILTK